METIDSFYANLNIYYALVLTSGSDGHAAARVLNAFDYPAVVVEDPREVEMLEQSYRIFVMPADMLAELVFIKGGSVEQYSVVFCLDQGAFDITARTLNEKRPACLENLYVTRISLD